MLVTDAIRNHQINRIVKVLLLPENATDPQRLRNVITYAYSAEKEIFEMATNRDAYCHLIGGKIYNIEQELSKQYIGRQQHIDDLQQHLGRQEHSNVRCKNISW
jgi:hypothetical protein